VDLQACIFDLDGVIVDTAMYHYLAWKRLAAELGIVLTEEYNERLKGVSRFDSLNLILALKGISLTDEEKNQLAEKKNKWFVDYIHSMTEKNIYPGVQPLISDLKKAGIRTALASSSKNAFTVLRQLGMLHQFDAIVDGNMIINTKPHPEIFTKTAGLLNVPPDKCLVIEDAAAGVEAAKAAGMSCVGIGDSAILHQADLVVSHVSEISLEKLRSIKLTDKT
jgi:beta-phosphoglucomutase